MPVSWILITWASSVKLVLTGKPMFASIWDDRPWLPFTYCFHPTNPRGTVLDLCILGWGNGFMLWVENMNRLWREKLNPSHPIYLITRGPIASVVLPDMTGSIRFRRAPKEDGALPFEVSSNPPLHLRNRNLWRAERVAEGKQKVWGESWDSLPWSLVGSTVVQSWSQWSSDDLTEPIYNVYLLICSYTHIFGTMITLDRHTSGAWIASSAPNRMEVPVQSSRARGLWVGKRCLSTRTCSGRIGRRWRGWPGSPK